MTRKHRATANPELARAMHDKRTSNAAGVHGDRRTKRLRDRSSRRREAIRDQDVDTDWYDSDPEDCTCNAVYLGHPTHARACPANPEFGIGDRFR